MKSKTKKRKSEKLSIADQMVAKAKKMGGTRAEQIEVVRWWRDVEFRGNLRKQIACATAIDMLKGYY